MSCGDSTHVLSTLEKVIEQEHCQIAIRREVVGLMPTESEPDQSGTERKKRDLLEPGTLVGLALSGGGVRSGAISLGFLMGLAKSGLLKHVDYLSTVSGGGYAGAVLSAEAMRLQQEKSDQGKQNHIESIFGNPDPQVGNRSDALNRLRHLVNKSNYLVTNQGWMSRAAMGALAMGTLLISAVTFAAASFAWLFRGLYAPEVYDYFHCLGFRGDLWVPMMPSIIVFHVWLFFWLFSFLRNGKHAAGKRAKYAFTVWLLTATMGFTLIATTGDLDIGQLLVRLGLSEITWTKMETFGSWVKTGVFAAICASLLPYFAPSALLRSGKERTAGPKRYLFSVARNGLLFGVPLLVFAFLARENISGWNDHRDDRIEVAELLPATGDVSALIGEQLFAEFASTRTLGPLRAASNSDQKSTQEVKRGPNDTNRKEETDPTVHASDVLKTARVAVQQQILNTDLQETLKFVDEARQKFRYANAGIPTTETWNEQSFGSALTEKSRLSRLTSFLAYLLSSSSEEANRVDFGRMLNAIREERKLKRLLLFKLNRELLDPGFFLVVSKAIQKDSGGEWWTEVKGHEELRKQVEELQKAIEHAASIAISLNAESSPTADFSESSLDLLYGNQIKYPQCGYQKWKATPLTEADKDIITSVSPSMQPLFHGLHLHESASGDGIDSSSKGDMRQAAARAILAANRRILTAVFPGTIRLRGKDAEVFNSIVHWKDQQARLSILLWSFCVCLISALVIDLNAISWHGFYSQQLSSFWVKAGSGEGRKIHLNSLNTVELGRPYHLINAAVTFPGIPNLGNDAIRDENPDEFLISRLYCGSDHSRVGFVRTTHSPYGRLTLGDAIALSGAAVSPWATRNKLVRSLLLIMNLRTGLWLPHPARANNRENSTLFDRIDSHFFPPLRWLVLRYLPHVGYRLGVRPSEEWSHVLVTDGGHYENLGIESLLRRRCKIIIAVDATQDEHFEFASLASVMRRMRVSYDLRFAQPDGKGTPFQFPTQLTPDKQSGFSAERILPIEIRYPADNDDVNGVTADNNTTDKNETALLILVKSTLLSDDPIELIEYRKQNSMFPSDPTSDQFFDPERFEAYRLLGVTSAERLVSKLGSNINREMLPKDFVKAFMKAFGCIQTEKATTSAVHKANPSESRSKAEMAVDAAVQLLKSILQDDAVLNSECQEQFRRVVVNLKALSMLSTVQLSSTKWDLADELPVLLSQVACREEFSSLRFAALESLTLILRHVQAKNTVEILTNLEVTAKMKNLPNKVKEMLRLALSQLNMMSTANAPGK